MSRDHYRLTYDSFARLKPHLPSDTRGKPHRTQLARWIQLLPAMTMRLQVCSGLVAITVKAMAVLQ